jgi:phosphoglycolate phosphatase-like HAD superfamily hydrolase
MSTPLDSWNDGAARNAIVDFVARVVTPDSPGFVPPADRIAVFDNDGTLWCEQPVIQLAHILQRWEEMVQQDPALADRQPWKAGVEKDWAWFRTAITKHYGGDESDMPTLAQGLLTAFEGLTTEAFAARCAAFFRTGAHPTLNRLYRDCGYAPMVELLRLLDANGFANYIVSGGGRDFVRQISGAIYGIPEERVIGSSTSLVFREQGDGGDLLMKAKLDVFDDGATKPARIWSRIGKRPILAAGNSNGDIPMLQFANKPPRPALRLLVLHDDADREFDYVSGAEGSLTLAKQYGWTVVSMKNDWKTVFSRPT